MIALRTLLENNLSRNRSLTAEHGLSFLVETGNKKILFDCSAGKAARRNAEKMHVSLKNVDYVIVSHSHYDHAGGYPDMVTHGVYAPLVTGERFFEEKYARDGDKYTYLGCGFGPELLEKKKISHLVCKGQLTLFEGCHVVGGFERKYAFEKPPARFVRLTADGMVEDDFPDEVCLVLEESNGLVVIAGCSHPGILNMLDSIQERFGRSVYAVFGGSHLVEADEERLNVTLDRLRDMELGMIGFNHCTGDMAQERLCAGADGVVYTHLKTGDCIFIPPLPAGSP